MLNNAFKKFIYSLPPLLFFMSKLSKTDEQIMTNCYGKINLSEQRLRQLILIAGSFILKIEIVFAGG